MNGVALDAPSRSAPRWEERAACRGLPPDLFFPGSGEDIEPQRALCRACPVRWPCMRSAIDEADITGIRGGLSSRELGSVLRRIRSGELTMADWRAAMWHRPSVEEIEAGAEAYAMLASRRPGVRPAGRDGPARRRSAARLAPRADTPAGGRETSTAPAAGLRSVRRLRPHQEVAVGQAVSALRVHDRIVSLMACGAGKTLVGQRVAEEVVRSATDAGRVLVAVPSLSLVDQTWRAWAADAETPFRSIAVCSDDDLTAEDLVDDVASIVAATGMVVTTDPLEIAAFLASDDPGLRVVFATYHSSPRVADAFRGEDHVPPFSLLVADEAHRTAGRLDSPFATVLADELVPARRRLFLTATKRTNARRATNASMDDEDLYGPVAVDLGFAEAIDQGLLSDFQVVVVAVNDKAALGTLQRGARIELEGAGDADPHHVAVAAALLEAAREYDLHAVLAFHDGVARSKAFSSVVSQVAVQLLPSRRPQGEVRVAHIDASVPGSRRRQLLLELGRSEPDVVRVLSSVRTIAEGVDVPAVDAVVFVDPRRSALEVIQAVGRAMRLNALRTAPSVVLIPLYVPDGGAVDLGEFEEVWLVLEALRRHDAALDLALTRLGTAAVRGPLRPGDASIDDALEAVGSRLTLPARLVPLFLDSFRARLLTQNVEAFERGLVALDRYVAERGDADVPPNYVDADGFELGRWVRRRRSDYQRGRLPIDRVLEFERRGFVWSAWDADFRRGVGALRDFRAQFPGEEVTSSYVAPDGFALDKWISSWCYRHARGGVSPDRLNVLRAHGVPVDRFSPDWDHGLAELDAHLAERPPRRVARRAVTASGFHVGLWLSHRVAAYLRGEMTVDQVEALEKRGVLPLAPGLDDWDRGYAALEAWVRHHGPGTPPQHVRLQGVRPWHWLLRRRYEHRAGRLARERREALARLGVDWAASGDTDLEVAA